MICHAHLKFKSFKIYLLVKYAHIIEVYSIMCVLFTIFEADY